MQRLLLTLALLFPALLRADPSLAPWFSDGAVLQQGRLVPVWGLAAPGERITVLFSGQSVSCAAAADGTWQVLLEPLAANATGSDLCIQGSTTLVVRDVLVGDVWLVAGQSGLSHSTASVLTSSLEPPHLAIHHLQLGASAMGGVNPPQWRTSAAAAQGGVSTLALLLGNALHKKTQIPLGIVTLPDPYAPIESWLSPATLTSSPSITPILQRIQSEQATFTARHAAYLQALGAWKQAEQNAKLKGTANHRFFLKKNPQPAEPRPCTPSASFNTMLAPLLPAALRGVVWCHGESNIAHADEYRNLLTLLVASFRAHLGDPELPVFIVQSAGYQPLNDASNQLLARLREAQSSVALASGTFPIITLDLSETPSVAPENKEEIARRITSQILARCYGIDAPFIGPHVTKCTLEGSKVHLEFAHAASGLIAYKKPVSAMEIAGNDGRFFPATVRIHGNTLTASSTSVLRPTSIRYAWSNFPLANLANGEGLPAAPFQLTVRAADQGVTAGSANSNGQLQAKEPPAPSR